MLDLLHRKTGYLRNSKTPAALTFFMVGFLSTLWFLVRVIPKPSRAAYPCMKAVYPVMSGFIVYLVGLFASAAAFVRSRRYLAEMRYLAAFSMLLFALVAFFVSSNQETRPVFANSELLLAPNQPVGQARGLFPGRVVWVWDPESTNETCTNQYGDGWFMAKNTNLAVVDAMLAEAVRQLSGKPSIPEAWDAFFNYFNRRKGRGARGYRDGEKIFIRTNQVSASNSTIDADYTIKNTKRYGMAETSPQVMLSVLRQLVNECGIRQEDIAIGDPMKHMYRHVYEMLHGEFPRVTYIDFYGTLGRTKPVAGSTPSILYSDCGTVLKSNGSTGSPIWDDSFPTVITEADYLVTIPALKAHARAGVTLCGKIHFGSNLRGSATHLHGGLVSPETIPTRTGYGLYRIQVDLMGHRDLGEKSVLFILDGLWAGSEANDPPRKFQMRPFNNDRTSSVFVSQDQVALESVGFDFLKTEFTSNNPYGSYPQMAGADDHILQAADSSFWPAGFTYDPEKDGTAIGSLGVCEHWNNPEEKRYSSNLGTGPGIELIQVNRSATSVRDRETVRPGSFKLLTNCPNPFNPSTTIGYRLPHAGQVSLVIYDVKGRRLVECVHAYQQAGTYTYRLSAEQLEGVASGPLFAHLTSGAVSQTLKMTFIR